MKRVLILSVLGALLLSGCSEKDNRVQETTEKVEDINIEEVTTEKELFDENGSSTEGISLRFGYDNAGSLIFENDRNVVETKLEFDSQEHELEIGVLVFVDGILQPLSVEGQEAKDFNVFNVNKQAEYDVSFNLISGDKDEEVRIDTISLLNPNFKVTENTKTFGLCFSTSSPLAYNTKCNEDVEAEAGATDFEYTELTDEVKEKYVLVQEDGSVINNLENNMIITYFQNGEEVTRLKAKNNELKFDIGLSGGTWKDYNVYVFYNNEVKLCFGEKKYNTVTTASDKMVMMSAEIDLTDEEVMDYSQLFVVAVPVGDIKDNSVYVVKLPNIIVEHIEE